MKLLNREPVFRMRPYPAEPEEFRFSVKGEHFVLDKNSLALWQLDSPDEKVPLCDKKPQFPHPPIATSFGMLVLENTQACPLACKYCFAQLYEDTKSHMSFETAKKAITMYGGPRDRRSPARIGFFGGEPLVNWQLIRDVVMFSEGYFVQQPRFSVTTNAVLMTSEKARFLKEHGFSIIVSIDGPQELHDEYRIYPNGKGSFEETLRGLKFLAEAGVKSITLRATYTPHHPAVYDRVVYLNELCDQGLARWVSVEPVCLTESHCIREMRGFTEEEVQRLEPEYIKISEWAVKRYKDDKPFRFHNIVKMMERLLYCAHSPSECGAGNGYMSVSYDGGIWSCHRMNWGRIGDLEHGIDEQLRAPWLDNRSYNREGCNECPIQWVCGGGCREASIGANRDIRKPYRVGCEFMKMFVRCAAWIISQAPKETLEKFIPDPRANRVPRCSRCGKPKLIFGDELAQENQRLAQR